MSRGGLTREADQFFQLMLLMFRRTTTVRIEHLSDSRRVFGTVIQFGRSKRQTLEGLQMAIYDVFGKTKCHPFCWGKSLGDNSAIPPTAVK
jgi:hypothetical protein